MGTQGERYLKDLRNKAARKHYSEQKKRIIESNDIASLLLNSARKGSMSIFQPRKAVEYILERKELPTGTEFKQKEGCFYLTIPKIFRHGVSKNSIICKGNVNS